MSKKLSEYNDYSGIDASLETSLYEYGLIWKCTNKRSKEYKFIYGVSSDAYTGNYIKFDYAHMTQKEFKSLINERWFNKKAVLSFMGTEKLVFPMDIHSLLQYHGYQNIFGSSYEPFEIEED
jgi:hypothetical protein